jgi:hypothetical protein
MSIDLIADPNNRKAEIQIKNIARYCKTGVRRAFYYLGKDLVKESKKLINKKPKKGRTYFIRKVIGGGLVRHIASAPGEAPARITSALFNSLDFDVQGSDRMEFGSKRKTQYIQRAIGKGFTVRGIRRTQIEYPRNLELGLLRGEGSPDNKKRPYLLPSINNNERNAREHFNREIKKALSKGER